MAGWVENALRGRRRARGDHPRSQFRLLVIVRPMSAQGGRMPMKITYATMSADNEEMNRAY
ncbi:MAG TPA: hypothetical protein VF083_13740, partial [Acidimicrobiia bacterium]